MAHPTHPKRAGSSLDDANVPSFVERAEAALQAGDIAGAISLCEEGLHAEPDHPLGRVVLGKALLSSGKALEARDQFARALAAAPWDGQLYGIVGSALLEKGLRRSAAKMLERAAELEPESPALRGGADTGGPQTGALGATEASPPSLPPRIPVRPPPLQQRAAPAREDLLDWLEELPVETEEAPRPEPTVEEALSAAAAYEQELRERLVENRDRRPGRTRTRLAWIVGLSLLVAGGTGFGAYEYRRAANREADIARFTAAARNGVVRDTRAAWLATIAALDEVLDRNPGDPTAKALKALAIATLGTVFGVEGNDPSRAASLLGEEETRVELEVVLATRWILTVGQPERAALEEEILGLPAQRSGATAHSLAGAILLERGDPAGAIERFNLAIAAMPSHVPTLVRVADYYRSRGEHGEALRYYELALAVAEDHPTAVLGAAEAHLALGADLPGLKGALSALDKAGPATSFPVVARVRRSVVRARLLSALDRREEALAELDSTIADHSDPSRLAAVALAFVQVGAPERVESLIGPLQGDSPLALREAKARSLLAQERHRLVGTIPVKAGERQLHLLQGIALYHLRDWTKARAALRATGTEQGGRLPADAVVYLSLIDRATGRGDKGRATLERLGTSPRARTAARWAWASVLRDEGRWDEAEEVLSHAIARDPQGVEPRCALGRLLLGRGDWAGAEEALQGALRLNPHHTEARIALARLALHKGDREAASAAIEAAFGVRQDSADVWGVRALGLIHDGERTRAEKALERALSLDRHSVPAHLAASAIARAQGDFPKALRSAKAAVGAGPHDLLAWLELGSIEWQLGNLRAAGQSLRRGLALAPSSVEAKGLLARILLLDGKVDEASRFLEEVLAAPRDSRSDRLEAQLLATRALVLQSRGDPKGASETLDAALQLLGESVDPDVSILAARVLAATDRRERADELLEKARAGAPNRPDLLLAIARRHGDTGENTRAREAWRRYLEVAPNGVAAPEARKVVGTRASR